MELKVKLKLKDVEIELSKEEAQELVETLKDIFGKEKEYVPYNPWYPSWPYYNINPFWKPWPEITWIADSGTDWTTNTISDNVQVSYTYQ